MRNFDRDELTMAQQMIKVALGAIAALVAKKVVEDSIESNFKKNTNRQKG